VPYLRGGFIVARVGNVRCTTVRQAVPLGSAVTFPKWESLENKSGKSGKFSSAKIGRQLTSVSPAIHHKFTIEIPRSAHRFCQNPQQKRGKPAPEKNYCNLLARRRLGEVGGEPLVGGVGEDAGFAEAAIAFELRLGEPLVHGGVVGEGVMFFMEVDEIGGEAVGKG
jgi:hypothetical protein